jgi:hypothetical protein
MADVLNPLWGKGDLQKQLEKALQDEFGYSEAQARHLVAVLAHCDDVKQMYADLAGQDAWAMIKKGHVMAMAADLVLWLKQYPIYSTCRDASRPAADLATGFYSKGIPELRPKLDYLLEMTRRAE